MLALSYLYVCHISCLLDPCWFYHDGILGSLGVSYCPMVVCTLMYIVQYRCAAVDVVLMDSRVTITCLECGRENTSRGFSYGQSKDVWCRRCHSKLTIYAEQCKFVQHQPRELCIPQSQVLSGALKQTKLRQKEPVLKQGAPLPEYGACQHYKKSHRWLRYIMGPY